MILKITSGTPERNKIGSAQQLHGTSKDPSWPEWPVGLRDEAMSISRKTGETLDACVSLQAAHEEISHLRSMDLLGNVLSDLSSLESKLVADLEQKHGPGRVDSPGFRQWMAEYEASFPAANLDTVREARDAFRGLHDWLESPEGSLAYRRAFVLSGAWGVGKTHGVCDIACQRLEQQLLTCVIFGHQFGGEPDPWTRLTESLGLPITLGKDGILDALNSAAEASGRPLILFIDAINETRPLRYWHDRVSVLVEEIKSRPSLRICFTCRTPYLPHCLPKVCDLPILEHLAFKGVERIACTVFFEHYGLKPPVAPILQPELANPLYLKLVCETLKSRGLDRLPAGWSGMSQVIGAFLDEKEKEFARDRDTSPGARIVTASLRSIASAMAESGKSALRWSEASKTVIDARPEASMLQVVEWLVGTNLLIQDAPDTCEGFDGESTVRLAFERLGDFLLALELLNRLAGAPLKSAFDLAGRLHPLVRDKAAVEANAGLLSALSILIPEREAGKELPDLVGRGPVHQSLVKIAVAAIPWRDSSSFSSASRNLVLEALKTQGLSQLAMDYTLSVGCQPSAIDAIWLHALLAGWPLAGRDAYWCGYLHESYEVSGPVKRLIDGAFDLPVGGLDLDVAERWATTLSWFTAAADRRVKDWATRALARILVTHPAVILRLQSRFLAIDDDEVRERLLLATYGSLILSRDTTVTRQVTSQLQAAFRHDPNAFDNALVRDHIRCLAELDRRLHALPADQDSQLTMQPIVSEWPLELPSDDQVEKLGKLVHFTPDEFLSDFFKYSMNCLRPWQHYFSKLDMGKWILQRVARDFRYEGSGCERYDRYMLGKYGGGRGKPKWAERIGKKYQWVAMYQLASRLNDHVERKRESWEPARLRTPLILVEERKLDTTLPPTVAGYESKPNPWWIASSVDPRSGKSLSDAEWVAMQEDLPALQHLLNVNEHQGHPWRLLVSYLSWGHRDEAADSNDPYRHVWMHVESYLVREKDIATAYDCLHRRNFFGRRWMPEGASWLYGFAGEYPWATPFNAEPEEFHSRGRDRGDLPIAYAPCWNQLAVEWEYDDSVPRNFHMIVPARKFFSSGDLWWDGQDGYRVVNGRTVFRDPSVTEGGPSSLIADADDLLHRLKKLKLQLIWTVLGEKMILGGPHDKAVPMRTFSQIARLNDNGSVQVGERVFFEDYDRDSGPKLAKRTPKKRKRRS